MLNGLTLIVSHDNIFYSLKNNCKQAIYIKGCVKAKNQKKGDKDDAQCDY